MNLLIPGYDTAFLCGPSQVSNAVFQSPTCETGKTHPSVMFYAYINLWKLFFSKSSLINITDSPIDKEIVRGLCLAALAQGKSAFRK